MPALWKDIIGSFCYHPQGQPRAQEGVEKWIPGSLASTVLKLLTWPLGILVNTQTLRKCIIDIFISPSGPPSDSRECLKIESWGPGLHSFEASKHEFWVLCSMWPLKKHYWYFLIPPSGPASGSRGCWKMESRGPGIQSLGAFNINFVYFVQQTEALWKNVFSY